MQDYKSLVVGTEWHYGDSVVIDEYFMFSEDGRFHWDNQGGGDKYGSYEIVDGKVIKLHYDNGDEKEMTIVSSELLKDWNGLDVTPVTYDDWDDEEEDDDDDN